MTDLRNALREIALDATSLDDVRARLAPSDRHWAPGLAAAGVVVVATATATAMLLTSGEPTVSPGTRPSTAAPTEPWFAVCFGVPDLTTGQRADQGMAQKIGAVNTAPRPEDWFDICAAHWQGDAFVMNSVMGADGSVPPAPPGLGLVACVLPDGTYGIFRGQMTICGDLGLPVAVAPDPQVGVLDESAEPTG